MESLKNTFKNRLILKPIIVSSCIFLVSFLIGLYLHDAVLPLIDEEITLNKLGTIEILKNNMSVCLTNIALGIVTLGLYGFVSSVYNGVSLGVVVGLAKAKYGVKVVMLRIIPHAIFELPTIIFSTAFGIMAVYLIIDLIKKKKINMKELVKQYFIVVMVVVIFVIIAALVEGMISMNLQ